MQADRSIFAPIVFNVMLAVALAFLLASTYILFFQVVYIGFDYVPSTGEVSAVFVEGNSLVEGDKLIQINEVTYGDYRNNPRKQFIDSGKSQAEIRILFVRGAEEQDISWVLPGPNRLEVLDRLISQWFIPYFFWIAAFATYSLVKPRDTRWVVLLFFYLLTSLWLSTGTGLAARHIGNYALLQQSLFWLNFPVYIHLHWIFPSRISTVPKRLFWSLYTGAAAMSVAEWLQIVPSNWAVIALMLSLLGSLILVLIQIRRNASHRREVILLFVAILMVLLPTSGILLAYLFGSPPSILLGGALLGFPALPAVYFYIIYRRQLGKSEIRANSLITQYLFVILMFTLAIAVIPFVLSLADYAGEEVVVGVGALLSGGLLTVFTYGPFSQFVRRKILGIPMQPEEVMQKLTSEITSKLSTKELATFLEESIVPTFLIKQSGLFYYRDRQMVESFYAAGVNKSQYPKTGDADNLIAHSNRYLVDGADTGLSDSLSWVRLALPLYEGEELIAFWLLGKRDPDDFYAQAEISSFRFLADQCAIALANIEQTKQLRALYQSNVTREEGERESLARDLHDVVLNELGLAQLDIEDKATAAKLKEINNFIRDTITGLRPPAISQGLYWGLAELCEELNARGDEHPTLVLEMPISMQRYDQDVELHSFRIVQQACENAFRHAEAKEVVINGSLESDNIQLWVEDDGRGFDDAGVDLSKLLENKHYGLASIVERANLIEADVRFGPGNVSGAKVSLAWVKQSS